MSAIDAAARAGLRARVRSLVLRGTTLPDISPSRVPLIAQERQSSVNNLVGNLAVNGKKSDERVEIRQKLLATGAIAMLPFPRARPAGVLDNNPASRTVPPFRHRR
jgi:hypothetical protein